MTRQKREWHKTRQDYGHRSRSSVYETTDIDMSDFVLQHRSSGAIKTPLDDYAIRSASALAFPCIILSNWNVIFHIPFRFGWCLAVLGKVSFLRQETNELRRVSTASNFIWLGFFLSARSCYRCICYVFNYVIFGTWPGREKKNNKTMLTTEETSLDTLTVLPATF